METSAIRANSGSKLESVTKQQLYMRNFTLTAFLVFGPLALVAASDEPAPQLEWRWSKEKATMAYSIKQHLQDYDVKRGNEDSFLFAPLDICTKKDSANGNDCPRWD
jgi:hypothetical protein